MADVTHLPETSRFETGEAYLTYVRDDSGIVIEHTIVPTSMEGQGVGGALVREAVAYGRAEGLDVSATCSFARTWLEKHQDA